MKEDEIREKAIKKLLKHFRSRLTLLKKYREMDLDKEILDCYNEINKLKQLLREIYEKNKIKKG